MLVEFRVMFWFMFRVEMFGVMLVMIFFIGFGIWNFGNVVII